MKMHPRTAAGLLLLSFLSIRPAAAAGPDNPGKISFGFYGFVRGDGSFDTRKSVTAFEGLFLLYPQDVLPDEKGEDLNKIATSGFYAFNSRAGVDAGGARLFNADLSARLEADFAGFSGVNGNATVLRIRHAFFNMKWAKSAFLLGQAWHPLFGPVTPDVISLSVGAPFNPFNRSPQFRFEYMPGKFNLTAAALYQFQFTSAGPEGKSNRYQRDAVLPELFLGGSYTDGHFTAGAGLNYLTIKPRTQSQVGEDVYKVRERLGSLSGSAYFRYSRNPFMVSVKALYGQNLSDMTMLGGYGIAQTDPVTGARNYMNFNHATAWVNLTYGRKVKAGIFGGYTKNLGSRSALEESSPVFGDGLALNNLYRLCGTLTCNLPHFMVGLEYEMTCAGYGDAGTFNFRKGYYDAWHAVANHRLVLVASYLF